MLQNAAPGCTTRHGAPLVSGAVLSATDAWSRSLNITIRCMSQIPVDTRTKGDLDSRRSFQWSTVLPSGVRRAPGSSSLAVRSVQIGNP